MRKIWRSKARICHDRYRDLAARIVSAVRVICAWCQQEGRSGLLRVREPLDDATETHGICERHQQEVFEAFPSASFPGTRWLFIVPSGDQEGYAHLVKLLQAVSGATVILDRRVGERRRGRERATPDRRRLDRRVRRPEKNALGYALVRFSVRDVGKLPGTIMPDGMIAEASTPTH